MTTIDQLDAWISDNPTYTITIVLAIGIYIGFYARMFGQKRTGYRFLEDVGELITWAIDGAIKHKGWLALMFATFILANSTWFVMAFIYGKAHIFTAGIWIFYALAIIYNHKLFYQRVHEAFETKPQGAEA